MIDLDRSPLFKIIRHLLSVCQMFYNMFYLLFSVYGQYKPVFDSDSLLNWYKMSPVHHIEAISVCRIQFALKPSFYNVSK